MIPSFSRVLLAACVAGAFYVSPARAQEDAGQNHPATKVVKDYLNLILAREWAKSGDLVEPKSLESLKSDFLRRIQNAPTMSDEETMLRRVGKSSIAEVEQMDARAFYTAYHFGLQERFNVTKEAMDALKKTLTLRLLSVAQEDETHVHVLVRTKHNNDKATIENLELVSLVKVGDAWRVGLNEQMPRMTPLPGAAAKEEGAAPAPPAETKPAPETKPAKPAAKGKGR